MISTLTLTPDCNIDYSKGSVIDETKIFKRNYDETDGIRIYDAIEKKEKTINVLAVSLYDHLPLVNGVQHKILHMLSK